MPFVKVAPQKRRRGTDFADENEGNVGGTAKKRRKNESVADDSRGGSVGNGVTVSEGVDVDPTTPGQLPNAVMAISKVEAVEVDRHRFILFTAVG